MQINNTFEEWCEHCGAYVPVGSCVYAGDPHFSAAGFGILEVKPQNAEPVLCCACGEPCNADPNNYVDGHGQYCAFCI